MSVHNPMAAWVAHHPTAVRIARGGWLAKGVVYVLAGALALVLAARAQGGATASTDGREASPNGAVAEVARHDGGTALLFALAAGLLLYALWRIVSAVLPGATDAHGWVVRIGYGVSAAIYASLGLTAVKLARTPAAPTDGNGQVTRTAGGVMRHAGGRWAVGVAGLIVMAVGLYHVVLGLRSDVSKELDLSGESPARRRGTRFLGAVGESGRGVGIALIGFFLARAAVTYRSSEATGLDGALRRLAVSAGGRVVVVVVGLGFVAYGVFCVATFPRRRFEAP